MGFKKGNQNIDSVFYGTDYVERMYLGRNQFFQASYLDFYKTNFFSIGLGQKKQIDRPGQAISLIKTEWSSQYGYQLEIKQDKKGASMNYTNSVFRDNFSFILPTGKYLANARLKNIPYTGGDFRFCILKKGETSKDDVYLTSPDLSNGRVVEVSVEEDTEVYLGMYINDLNVGKTSIFSLELYPATGEEGKFVEDLSLMVRGRKKEIYNSSVSSINITIPETAFYSGKEYPVEYIDSDAFNYEVTENGETVSQPLTKISTISVEGNSMVGFGNRAFKNCSSCTSFSCSSRYFIGSQAFENCTGITSINLPNTVTSIGSEAFKGCSNLETINIPFIGESATSTNNTFSYIFGTVPTSLTTVGFSEGNNITKIPEYAFSGCSGLTSITIPDSVTNIKDSAFSGCSGLTSITIPNSVTSIGMNAFSGCSGLTSITIPNSVTRIGSYAFRGCSGLTSITISNSVTTIGVYAFSGCSGLTSITIPNSVTTIGVYAFSGCSGLTSITIPNSVTTIGVYAFSGCSGLTSITIPNSVTSIKDGAFRDCSGLTSITIPNSVTTIGVYAFSGCSGLTSITIPDSVTSIKDSAFEDCSGLTSITIPDSVTSIGTYAFRGCSGLTSITISNGITSIGAGAFSGCSGLTSITIPDSVTNIKDSAFSGCSGLTSITIPNSVTSIGMNAFRGCSGLTSITIPNSVTSIGSYAFSGCSNLTIYAEATSKPSGWNDRWNPSNRPVVWGYKG